MIFFYSEQEGQIVLLLNETATTSESSGNACLMLVQECDLPFVSLSTPNSLNSWKLDELTVHIILITFMDMLGICHQLMEILHAFSMISII